MVLYNYYFTVESRSFTYKEKSMYKKLLLSLSMTLSLFYGNNVHAIGGWGILNGLTERITLINGVLTIPQGMWDFCAKRICPRFQTKYLSRFHVTAGTATVLGAVGTTYCYRHAIKDWFKGIQQRFHNAWQHTTTTNHTQPLTNQQTPSLKPPLSSTNNNDKTTSSLTDGFERSSSTPPRTQFLFNFNTEKESLEGSINEGGLYSIFINRRDHSLFYTQSQAVQNQNLLRLTNNEIKVDSAGVHIHPDKLKEKIDALTISEDQSQHAREKDDIHILLKITSACIALDKARQKNNPKESPLILVKKKLNDLLTSIETLKECRGWRVEDLREIEQSTISDSSNNGLEHNNNPIEEQEPLPAISRTCQDDPDFKKFQTANPKFYGFIEKLDSIFNQHSPIYLKNLSELREHVNTIFNTTLLKELYNSNAISSITLNGKRHKFITTIIEYLEDKENGLKPEKTSEYLEKIYLIKKQLDERARHTTSNLPHNVILLITESNNNPTERQKTLATPTPVNITTNSGKDNHNKQKTLPAQQTTSTHSHTTNTPIQISQKDEKRIFVLSNFDRDYFTQKRIKNLIQLINSSIPKNIKPIEYDQKNETIIINLDHMNQLISNQYICPNNQYGPAILQCCLILLISCLNQKIRDEQLQMEQSVIDCINQANIFFTKTYTRNLTILKQTLNKHPIMLKIVDDTQKTIIKPLEKILQNNAIKSHSQTVQTLISLIITYSAIFSLFHTPRDRIQNM